MDRPRSPRRRPEALSTPTSLHEITRRYVATALALSKAMGLPWTEEFVHQHRESITSCFIQAGMEGLRLPSAVQIPPLEPVTHVTRPGDQAAPVLDVQEEGVTFVTPGPELNPDPLPPGAGEDVAAPAHQETLPESGEVSSPPLIIPLDRGLPCAGQVISALKPAALMMVINRVAASMHTEEREHWVGLLAALQSERARRLEAGRRSKTNGQG